MKILKFKDKTWTKTELYVKFKDKNEYFTKKYIIK